MITCPRIYQRMLRVFLFVTIVVVFVIGTRLLIGKVYHMTPLVRHVLGIYQPNPHKGLFFKRGPFRVLPQAMIMKLFSANRRQIIKTNMESVLANKTVNSSNATSPNYFKPKITSTEYFKPRSHIINPHPFKFVRNGSNICENAIPSVMIIIFSIPSHRTQRQVIRNTWAGHVTNGIWMGSVIGGAAKLAFLFGKSVHNSEEQILYDEERQYKDIIQEDFLEAYENMTVKSVAALLWVSTFCRTAKYYLKTDDDVFVHVPRLLSFLKSLPKQNVIYGRLNIGLGPMRLGSKWMVSRDAYPFKFYPRYTSGGGYVMPVSITRALFNQSQYFPYIQIEDVFVTGVLRFSLGYKLAKMHCKIERRTRNHSAACDMAKDANLTLIHACDPNTMFQVWDELNTNGSNCPTDIFLYKQGSLKRNQNLT